MQVAKGTQLHGIVGADELQVNSAHHQAAADAPAGIVVNATAPDGVIEGIEAPRYRFCIGVQWHPEFLISEGDAKTASAPSLGAAAPSERTRERDIAKRLARAGLCSRRDAERWIAAGRVKVDGKVLDTPAFIVTDASRIEVDGKPLPDADRARLWRYHKPTESW